MRSSDLSKGAGLIIILGDLMLNSLKIVLDGSMLLLDYRFDGGSKLHFLR